MLEKGDVLFWNSWTIHGSLDSHDPERSRSSITCQAIPEPDLFLQMQSRVLDLRPGRVNGVQIHRPKDLAVLRNRAIFVVETRFPTTFYWLKRHAIRWMVRAKELRGRRMGMPGDLAVSGAAKTSR